MFAIHRFSRFARRRPVRLLLSSLAAPAASVPRTALASVPAYGGSPPATWNALQRVDGSDGGQKQLYDQPSGEVPSADGSRSDDGRDDGPAAKGACNT